MNIPFMSPSIFHMSSSMPASVSLILSFYASLCSTYMIVRGMWDQFVRTIPDPVRTYIYARFRRFFKFLSSATDTDLTMIIGQYTNGAKNQIYDAAGFYLRNKISPDSKRLQLSKTPRETKASVTIDRDQAIVDVFRNVKLTWSFVSNGKQSMHSYRRHDDEEEGGGPFGDAGHFVLTFPSIHKDLVMDEYVPYVFEEANKIKKEQKVIKIYSRSGGYSSYDGNWGSTNLEHPSTFDTLAMEPELKKSILEDLDMFVSRGEFYKNVGKAWKRGYLLYGPPGTGKSSLIAAMANYLKFDIYDLELTSVSNDKDLKKILLSTTNRSILVIEDIDCSVKVRNRQREREEESSDSSSDSDNNNNKPTRNRQYPQSKFTLSGLLNFTDGLWSSCGDERIVVFTTNHKERLDPALLRPGRMDMHIHMSYCTPNGFKILASNYHGIGEDKRHRLCEEIEGLISSTEVTPAEVAEELMRSADANVALQALVDFVKRKKVENEERKGAEEEKKRERRLKRMRRKEAEENIGDKSELVAELRKQIKKLKCGRANYDYDYNYDC